MARRTVLVANPGADVYGSDLQMLQSVAGLAGRGWHVLVVTAAEGPLVTMLLEAGAEVRILEFPVLRRATMAPVPMFALGWRAATALPRLISAIRKTRPDVVYVNTVTIPWWLLAGRLSRRPVLCHVHEAEMADSRLVRLSLNLPLLLADHCLVISRAAMTALTDTLPALRRRATLVPNGVPGPPEDLPAPRWPPRRLTVVGRLSPRKAPHVALEAVATLRGWGYPVELEVCGSPFVGYEWYEHELRTRASRPDLAGAVTFSGYVAPVWRALSRADVVLAPSLREPFGNAVVEAQLAGRPVVAAAALGHLESIVDGTTGLLVPPGDHEAMAAAVKGLIDDRALAESLAAQAQEAARHLFGVERYVDSVEALIAAQARGHGGPSGREPTLRWPRRLRGPAGRS